MKLKFSKMHGLGNDFMVIDGINQTVSLTPEQIKRLADRHFGVGFDQLLLVEKPQSEQADFLYRIFNADGGEVEQCGNGARCFARFVREEGLSDKNAIPVDTNTGRIVLHINDADEITVDMGEPQFEPAAIPLHQARQQDYYDVIADEQSYRFGAVSMGNPHAVLEVADVERAPVNELGPLLEHHALFPKRANIGFMQIVDRQHIRLRVFERGVGETLACGTGACAAVVVGIARNQLDSSVEVSLPGGKLQIDWAGPGRAVMLTGPAETVFRGEISFN